MDTNATVESTGESSEQALADVRWKDLVHDVDARLTFLKKLRAMPGTKDMVPVVSDTILRIARGEDIPAKEVEDLHDTLLIRGVKLETTADSAVIPATVTPPEPAPVPSDTDQGYGTRRLPPEFPAPSAPPVSAPEATPPDPKMQFLRDMQTQLAGAHVETPSWSSVVPEATKTAVPTQLTPTIEAVAVSPAPPIAPEIPAAPPPAPLISPEVPATPPVDISREVVTESGPIPEDTTAILMSPEVTEGMGELLSKWPPFDKSGLLGFGKHGLEHPLYVQLAGLPIKAVLSGQWKGADRSIIENIQSYMSGWEREQGITPDPEETFETYLRRVIAQILNTAQEQAPRPVAA